ncbi:unnamed protein product, partial [Tetraodon nigroviridis]
TCKVTSVSKHKERKPKKPHYIPRPWGKPYNYKCFQCPFTCMEKSHLYNHMKYSLCKNSLSLLIESDWPYKKGNLVHPEQLRPFQQAHVGPEQLTGSEERPRLQRASEEEEREEKGQQGVEDEDEAGRGEGAEVAGLTKESSGVAAGGGGKKSKAAESELLVADVLSLEEQLLQARSADVEAQLKHYKTCLTAPSTLTEQWRLLTSSHRKVKNESAQPRVGGSIPCYPPPQTLMDYQDQTGLNLSMLGVGYPLSPGLFSYMSSSIPAAATGVAAQTPMGQFPFLASAAQLLHPASGPTLTGLCRRCNLWKVPALRPGAAAGSPGGWASPHRDSPDQGCRLETTVPAGAKEGKGGWSLKRTGAPLGVHEAPVEKKQAVSLTLNLLKNIQNVSTFNTAADKLLKHDSEASSLSACGGPAGQESAPEAVGEGPSESVAALLTDLSKALQEYQDGERKISHLEKEDLPAQRHLWEHLSKIRSELSHIHQALERTGRNSDSPLDLSVKREEEKQRKAMRTSLESRKQSLDMLIKMSQVGHAELLSPGGLSVRSSSALWPNRTTKCEADSSVLLCPDGRSVVFTDLPPSAKSTKRPPSVQRLEAQGPPSPLTAPEN